MPRKRLFYFILFSVTAVLSFLYDEDSFYIAVIVLTLMPLISFLFLLYYNKEIALSLESERTVLNKEKSGNVYINVVNRQNLPIPAVEVVLSYRNLFSTDAERRRYCFHMEAKKTECLKCSVTAVHCGNIEFSIDSVYVYDMLGILRLKQKSFDKVDLSVLPRVYECGNLKIHNSSDVFIVEDEYSSAKSGDDPSEVFKIREFIEGDKMNRIHWKLSAKQGQLMTKEFGLPLDFSVLIFIEMCPEEINSVEYMDAVVETAAAISEKLNEMGQLHFIAWYDVLEGQIKRYKIYGSEDTYLAIGDLYSTNLNYNSLSGIKMYYSVYDIEKYSDVYYIVFEPKEKDYMELLPIKKEGCLHMEEITNISRKTFLKRRKTFLGKRGRKAKTSNKKIKDKLEERVIVDYEYKPPFIDEKDIWNVIDYKQLTETIRGIS